MALFWLPYRFTADFPRFTIVKIFLFRIGTREEVVSLLHLFVSSIQKDIDPQEVCFQIIQKLKNIRDIANQSIFFKNYKVKQPLNSSKKFTQTPESLNRNLKKYIYFSLLVHHYSLLWKLTEST